MADRGVVHGVQVVIFVIVAALMGVSFTAVGVPEKLACAVGDSLSLVAGDAGQGCEADVTPSATADDSGGLFSMPAGQGIGGGSVFSAQRTSPAYWNSCAQVPGGPVPCVDSGGQVVACNPGSESPSEPKCGALSSYSLDQWQCAVDSGAAAQQGGVLCVVPGIGPDVAGTLARCTVTPSKSLSTFGTCTDTAADVQATLDPKDAASCTSLFQLKRFETVFACQDSSGSTFRCTAPGVRAEKPTECGSRTFDPTEMDCKPAGAGSQASCIPKGAGTMPTLTCTVLPTASLPAGATSSVLGKPQHCHTPDDAGVKNPGSLDRGCPASVVTGGGSQQQPGRGLQGEMKEVPWWELMCPVLQVMMVNQVWTPEAWNEQVQPVQSVQAQQLQPLLTSASQSMAEELYAQGLPEAVTVPFPSLAVATELPDVPLFTVGTGTNAIAVIPPAHPGGSATVIIQPDLAAQIMQGPASEWQTGPLLGYAAGLAAAMALLPALTQEAAGLPDQEAYQLLTAVASTISGQPAPGARADSQIVSTFLTNQPSVVAQAIASLASAAADEGSSAGGSSYSSMSDASDAGTSAAAQFLFEIAAAAQFEQVPLPSLLQQFYAPAEGAGDGGGEMDAFWEAASDMSDDESVGGVSESSNELGGNAASESEDDDGG